MTWALSLVDERDPAYYLLGIEVLNQCTHEQEEQATPTTKDGNDEEAEEQLYCADTTTKSTHKHV